MSKRSREYAWLEGTRIYFKKGRYVVVESWKPHVERTLAPGSSTKFQVLSAYEGWMNRGTDTINGLVAAYLDSEQFRSLAPSTQDSYRQQLEGLCSWEMPRLRSPFGTLKLEVAKNKAIQSAFDQMEPNIARNRRFKYLKLVFAWGIQRHSGVHANPVVGLKLMEEKPRRRYVSDQDYQIIFDLAPTTLQLMMDAAHLLRLRRVEISELRRKLSPTQITEDCSGVIENGILIHRRKGSWGGLVVWSKALRNFVSRCNTHNRDRATPWLIRNDSGGRVTKSALDSYWRRVWKKAEREYQRGEIAYLPTHFTFHDLKAKGVTDHPDKESGHKSPKMKEVYDRENRHELPTR